MSDKQKLDMACELLRKAIKNTVPCPDVNKKWVELSMVSTQKKKLMAKQNSRF